MKELILQTLILSLLILFFSFYSLFDINRPLSKGHPGFILGQYSEYAMNYIKFGYIKTKLGQLWNIGSLESGKEVYGVYTHRPIGTSLLLSISFKLFGVSEFSARIVQFFANLLIILFIFFILRDVYDTWIGIITVFLLISSPMFFYMRDFTTPDSLGVFAGTGSLLFYTLWLRKQKLLLFIILSLFLILHASIDWTAYFLILSILLHYCLFYPKRVKKYSVFLISLGISTLFLTILHIWLVGGKKGLSDILFTFLFRTNLNKESWKYGITVKGLLQHLYRDLSYFYTPLSFLLIGIQTIKIAMRKNREVEVLFLLVLLSFLSFLFVFSNLYWIHDFLVLLLLPGIFLVSASSINFIKTITTKNFKLLIIVFIILYTYLSYPRILRIYKGNVHTSEFIRFLAENKGDVIVSFDEHPQNFQLKFYLLRNAVNYGNVVRDVRDLDELKGCKNFDFFIVKNTQPLEDKELEEYLINNFKFARLKDNGNYYTVFFLK